MSKISSQFSQSMQVANLIATVLVVAIHYNSKYHINPYDLGGWNYLFQEFLTNGVARVAVPFFAFSAGFFYFLKFEFPNYYLTSLKKRVSTLLIPFFIAAVVILIADYVLMYLVREEGIPEDWGSGIIYSLLHPNSVQFWFLRDLIILIVLSPLVFYLVRFGSWLLMLALTVLWYADYQFMPMFYGWYLLNVETIYFFTLGCFLVMHSEHLDRWFLDKNKAFLFLAVLVMCALFAIRVEIKPIFGSWYLFQETTFASLMLQKTGILMAVYLLIACSSFYIRPFLLYLSGFTFFVFLYHLYPLSKFVSKLGNYVVEDQYLFFVNFPVATIVSFYLAHLMNKYLKPLYDLLTGARDPKKVLSR